MFVATRRFFAGTRSVLRGKACLWRPDVFVGTRCVWGDKACLWGRDVFVGKMSHKVFVAT